MPKGSTKRRGLKLVTAAKPKARADYFEALKPLGYREGDVTLSLTPEDDSMSYAGLYAGDTALIYATADVAPDDLAAVEIRGETWLGKYRPAPGGYFSFERDEQAAWFRPGMALLLGRVCHFERKGVVIRQMRSVR